MAKKKTEGERVVRTFKAGGRSGNKRSQLDAAVDCALEAAITDSNVAIQLALQFIHDNMDMVVDENDRLETMNLYIPTEDLSENQRTLVANNIAKERKAPKDEAGTEAKAMPYYKNSYRLEEVVPWRGRDCARFELARAYEYVPQAGPLKDQVVRKVSTLDAKQAFQQLIAGYFPIRWPVGKKILLGACQQAAQQFNSHIGLTAGEFEASFPSLLERHPQKRLVLWHEALTRSVLKEEPFTYERLRDLAPSKYAKDDPRGDRSANTDEDWRAFLSSPFPGRQPLLCVESKDIVVYRFQSRLFASLPIFRDTPPGSALAGLSETDKRRIGWWKKQAEQFEPLPLWGNCPLKPTQPVMLVELEARHLKRLEDLLSAPDGRKSCWTLVSERTNARRRYKNRRQWELCFVTSREVMPQLRPNVLGIHFGTEPLVWWALVDAAGNTLKRGCLQQNEVLTEGLARQLRLHDDQKEQRWVGNRKFTSALRQRTFDVVRLLVDLAADLNANLALEKISYVKKAGPNHKLNRRFSMWNYSQLLKTIRWKGLERRSGEQDDPVATIREVSDYVLRFTCPKCDACRTPQQKKPATERRGDVLVCHRCGFEGPVPDEHQAAMVATLGAQALSKRLG